MDPEWVLTNSYLVLVNSDPAIHPAMKSYCVTINYIHTCNRYRDCVLHSAVTSYMHIPYTNCLLILEAVIIVHLQSQVNVGVHNYQFQSWQIYILIIFAY